MKKKNKIFPIIIALCLVVFLVALAFTDFFTPLSQYLHDYSITPLGAAGCLLGAILIFYGVYKILVKLGQSLLPDEGKNNKKS